jgi:type IV pilus assembly protein PilC
LPAKRLVPFCRQLATSYEAGIPILRSFELIGRENKDPKVREICSRMHQRVANGDTLEDAARAESRYLPTFFTELISSGEVGGKLDVMLRDLAEYFEDRLAMRRRIVRMMTYPLIQLTAAWFLGTFAFKLMGQVMATFSDRTANFSFEAFLSDYGWFQAKAVGGAAVVIAICIILSRMGVFPYIGKAVTTFVWPFSRVTRRFGLARFFRSMSLLLGSGMNVKRCIERAAATTANPYMEKDLLRAVPVVANGGSLVEAFATSRMLTPTALEMLAVGEESGQLEAALRKASEYNMEEASHAVNVATRIIGVLIALAVAGIIGYVIISFYAGLYGGMLNELGV